MKKAYTLIFVALFAMLGLKAQAAMWLVGDAFNDGWKESGNVQMVEGNDGIYTYTANLTAGKGFAFFKDNEGWNNQRGPQTKEAAPTGDWEVTASGSNSWKVATTGEYKIEYNYETDQAKIALVTQEQFDPTKRKFAVTGAAFGGWNMPPAANQTFTNNGDGTYTLKYEGATAGEFKLSSVAADVDFTSNWDEVFNPGTLGVSPLVEGDNILSSKYGWDNMNFPVSGNVTLTISDVTESSCKLNIAVNEVPDKAWYIAGNFTTPQWGDGKLAMTDNGDGTFSITVNGMQTGNEFKFVNEYDRWFGGETTDISANNCTDIALSNSGDNFKIASGGGDLTFTIDAENKLTVTGWEEPVVDYLLHYGTASSDWQDVTFVAGEGDNEGKLVATATFAKNTEFGIKHGDTWYAGLVEQGDNYIIKYDWCTNIPLDSEGNIKNFLIAEAGTYTFVLTVGQEGITMDVQGLVEPQYVLNYGHDGENDWQNATFVVGEGTYEGKLVAKDVEFTAVKTQFGVKYGDIWYAGLPNAGEGLYWIHDTWCTNIPLSTGDGVKNFIINEIGTYTFVLTVGENSITMDVEGFPVAPVLGDVDGNGSVDVSDVNAIINIILGKANAADYPNANVNGDSGVDVTDVNAVINIILGKSGDTTGEGE